MKDEGVTPLSCASLVALSSIFRQLQMSGRGDSEPSAADDSPARTADRATLTPTFVMANADLDEMQRRRHTGLVVTLVAAAALMAAVLLAPRDQDDAHPKPATAFGAITDVHQEGPNGSFKAFADDPTGHARLLEETHKVGLATGEPAVLAGEAVTLQSKGDLWKLVGASKTARAEYLRALAYSVASVAGLAKQNALPFGGREDPKVQEALLEYQDRLTPQDRDVAFAEGERIAQGWRPLLTPQQRVDGRLPT